MEIARSLHCWIFGKHPFGSFHRFTSLLFSLFVCWYNFLTFYFPFPFAIHIISLHVVTSDACKMFEEDDKQYEESCRSKLRNVSSDFQLDHYSASDMRDFNADKYLPAAIKGRSF